MPNLKLVHAVWVKNQTTIAAGSRANQHEERCRRTTLFDPVCGLSEKSPRRMILARNTAEGNDNRSFQNMVFCRPIFWYLWNERIDRFPAASISILKMREVSSRVHRVVALSSEESFWPIARRRICSELQTLWYNKSSGRVTRVGDSFAVSSHFNVQGHCFLHSSFLTAGCRYQHCARWIADPHSQDSGWGLLQQSPNGRTKVSPSPFGLCNIRTSKKKTNLQAPHLFGGPEKGRGKGQMLSTAYPTRP